MTSQHSPLRVLFSRRSVVAIIGMLCLLVMNLANQVDTSNALASICIAVAASNAFQRNKTPPAN